MENFQLLPIIFKILDHSDSFFISIPYKRQQMDVMYMLENQLISDSYPDVVDKLHGYVYAIREVLGGRIKDTAGGGRRPPLVLE